MDEQQIFSTLIEYLEKHNFVVKRLQPDKLTSNIKCPDFEVMTNKKIKFYCEVKSPKLQVNKFTNMFHYSTLVTKLRDHIHKAVAQFSDKDSKHSFPWVLIFTSNFMQLNWTSMLSAISGKVIIGDKTISDLRHLNRVRDTNEDVNKVDIFVWLQMNQKSQIIQVRMYLNPYTIFSKETMEICKLFTPDLGDKSFNR